MTDLPVRKSYRLKNYDYSTDGYYFITINAKYHAHIFGEVTQDFRAPLACARVDLTFPGKLIDKQWNDLPNQFNHIVLDEYVIMPNHIHGILIFAKQAGALTVQTISEVIRSFKSRSSVQYLKYIKEKKLNISAKIWQRSFHDHIIRNERALNEIRKYIQENPMRWWIKYNS